MPTSTSRRTPTRWAGLAPDDRRAERRTLLLDAAFELLGTEGWGGTTVRAVCQEARLNPRYFYESFEDLDARPCVDRAAAELRASGESARKRDESEPVRLTAQELAVASLVQQGLSNREVAAQLFLSPRTIDFHLRNVFTKTGVRSRVELATLTLV